ncbi:hypothetical protein [uncultured Thiodictyon sp.]|uniref:hypothetical protein n=1 Tax=uncultured Thiodictyon sp. TaxID=1846217 RepID=UPI0025D5906B|nr:hypothetical protein [uncultured Thiodictyon sp.]
MPECLSPDDLVVDIRETYNERAAILEHDAGLSRKVAEALSEVSIRVYFADVRDTDCLPDAPIRRVTIITHGQTLDEVKRDCVDRFGIARLVGVRAYQGDLCLSE